MKNNIYNIVIMLTLLTGINQAAAQEMRFFRVAGPTATTIIAFQSDGAIVLSNAQPDATYTLQTASSLLGGTNWVDYTQISVNNGVTTNQIVDFNPPVGMAFIPGGVFTMGDTLDGEGDAIPIRVTVSAFYMDTNLVSSNQWRLTYNWATNAGYGFDHVGAGNASNYPVETVSWYDTVKWCNARSQQVGLTPVYYTDAALTQVYNNGQVIPYVNWSASGYRLPTEAEWEKAARGGLSGQRFPWGDIISENLANYYGDSFFYNYDLGPNFFNAAFTNGNVQPSLRPFTSPVGYFAANGYGLYDMAGNVFEACWDWYGQYGLPTTNNPTGPAEPVEGNVRVVRGGCWDTDAFNARCACRDTDTSPSDAGLSVGFRCVRRH